MSDNSLSEDEYDLNFSKKNFSINPFQMENKIRKGFDQQRTRKRCSSAAINIPKNFAPKLRPKKSYINPSPIILNDKPPPKFIREIQYASISTSSFDSKNEFKTFKIKVKDSIKSIKYINEKVHANSDCEENNNINEKSDSDSNSSQSGEKNKIHIKKEKHINAMRLKMAMIRRKSFNDNIVAVDDSSLKKNMKKKCDNIFRNIQKKFINKNRNNKNLCVYPLDSVKYRNKSHNARYPTILGFLEKTKSTVSLNSVGK